jgi:uncharacterized Zn-finger protein
MDLSPENISKKEQDKKEFDEIYQLLLTLSKTKFSSNDSDEKQINTINHTQTNHNSLQDLFNTKKYICKGCDKGFISDHVLSDHLDKSKACKKWLSLSSEQHTLILKKPIHQFIDDCLSKSLMIDQQIECKFCNSTFVNKGNLHKHFSTSIPCNRLAYHEFKTLFLSI